MRRAVVPLLIVTLVAVSLAIGLNAWFLPSYRAHRTTLRVTAADSLSSRWPVRSFPATTILVYMLCYEVTVRPVTGLPGLRQVTVRYDPTVDEGWHSLHRWRVLDSFVMSRDAVAMRSYRDNRSFSAVMRISYPIMNIKVARRRSDRWVDGFVKIDLRRQGFVQRHSNVRVVYYKTLNWLPLRPSTKSAEPARFDGLELKQANEASNMESRENWNKEIGALWWQIPLLAPVFLAPEAAEGEAAVAGAVEGLGAEVAGEEIGEAAVGEVAAGVAAPAMEEATGEAASAGASRLAGMRLNGASWCAMPEEAYEVEANGSIRALEWSGPGRVVGEVGAGGRVVGSEGFLIDGRPVRWIASDGSLFTDQSVGGFIGKIQPDGSITSMFGEQIGSAAAQPTDPFSKGLQAWFPLALPWGTSASHANGGQPAVR